MKKVKEILKIFLLMVRIGAFTFGGGYAMLSLLQREFVEKRGWLTGDEFVDLVAVSESTPGPIAINAATYVGYKAQGFLGSLAATVGVVLPSFAIIYVISLFFDSFLSVPIIANAFRGIQAAVIFLILSAALKMLKSIKKKPFSVTVICTVAVSHVLLSLFAVKLTVIVYILVSAVISLSIYLLHNAKKGDKAV